jgi:hypothetical protein
MRMIPCPLPPASPTGDGFCSNQVKAFEPNTLPKIPAPSNFQMTERYSYWIQLVTLFCSVTSILMTYRGAAKQHQETR